MQQQTKYDIPVSLGCTQEVYDAIKVQGRIKQVTVNMHGRVAHSKGTI